MFGYVLRLIALWLTGYGGFSALFDLSQFPSPLERFQQRDFIGILQGASNR